jgi:hypothetical protein
MTNSDKSPLARWRRATRRIRMRATSIIASLAMLSLPSYPHIHVDPDGAAVTWYPAECCNNRDCRPVAHVRQAAHGLWMTTIDGVTVLVDADEQRRPSRDMRWHLCLTTDIYQNVVVQCLFEPPNS